MTRAEHLQWAKDRALEYVDQGDINAAFTSFRSDMSKHEELKTHSALDLFATLFYNGHLGTSTEMRRFIEGFN